MDRSEKMTQLKRKALRTIRNIEVQLSEYHSDCLVDEELEELEELNEALLVALKAVTLD